MHHEHHADLNLQSLRAAVLGANDGILSISSLLVGMASGHAAPTTIVITGISGLVAGAMSMATGEYVSVSSQADSERANLSKEAGELDNDWDGELAELAGLYHARGVAPDVARTVAFQLMQHDALDAHAREELGIMERTLARPMTAAMASAAAFAIGAALPVLAATLAPAAARLPAIVTTSLMCLGLLGVLGASAGGARAIVGARRVIVWGVAAMVSTYMIGRLVGEHLP